MIPLVENRDQWVDPIVGEAVLFGQIPSAPTLATYVPCVAYDKGQRLDDGRGYYK